MKVKAKQVGSVLYLDGSITVAITRYDLVAVACLLLSKSKKCTRGRILDGCDSIVRQYGVTGFCKALERYFAFEAEACAIVSKLFPELMPPPGIPSRN